MKKSDEVKEFIVVLIVSFGVALIFITLLMYSGPPPEPQKTFKVVDHYNNCDVVRYTDRYNRYHYFLNCQ